MIRTMIDYEPENDPDEQWRFDVNFFTDDDSGMLLDSKEPEFFSSYEEVLEREECFWGELEAKVSE